MLGVAEHPYPLGAGAVENQSHVVSCLLVLLDGGERVEDAPQVLERIDVTQHDDSQSAQEGAL